MPKKLETFEVKIEDTQEIIKLALLQVDAAVGRKALAEYNRAFSAAVTSGALLRTALQNHMREQNIWNEKKEKEYQNLIESINEKADKLARGGIKLKDARQVAVDIRRARFELRELISERTSLDTNTAEGQAENARFNFIVSEVTVNDTTGEKYFKDMDDYLSKSTDPVAIEAASRLGKVMYGLDPNYETSLPENKFLKKWKFCDEELRLVNEDGHFVDADGRLIDEDGRWVDDQGRVVDADGNLLTEDGELDVEAQPFLDDQGNPIADPDEEGSSTQPTNFGEEEEQKTVEEPSVPATV
jgi:hypothetical protein